VSSFLTAHQHIKGQHTVVRSVHYTNYSSLAASSYGRHLPVQRASALKVLSIR